MSAGSDLRAMRPKFVIVCARPGCGKRKEVSDARAKYCGSTCRSRACREAKKIALADKGEMR